MDSYKPNWNRDVSPHFLVDDIKAQIKFLQKVFDAKIIEAPKLDGEIFHAELQIGDSVVMLGRASKDFPARQGSAYVYVRDVQKVFDKAMQHGAKSLMQPQETPWGNIDSGFDDPAGNRWWVATLIKPMTEADITEAMKRPKKA